MPTNRIPPPRPADVDPSRELERQYAEAVQSRGPLPGDPDFVSDEPTPEQTRARALVEKIKERRITPVIKIGTIAGEKGELENTVELQNLKRDFPALYGVLITSGIEGFNKEVNKLQAENRPAAIRQIDTATGAREQITAAEQFVETQEVVRRERIKPTL